jgi:hypothetical protein
MSAKWFPTPFMCCKFLWYSYILISHLATLFDVITHF